MFFLAYVRVFWVVGLSVAKFKRKDQSRRSSLDCFAECKLEDREKSSINRSGQKNGLKPKMKESMLKYLDSGAELTVLHIKKAIVAQVKSNSQLISKNDEPTPF